MDPIWVVVSVEWGTWEVNAVLACLRHAALRGVWWASYQGAFAPWLPSVILSGSGAA